MIPVCKNKHVLVNMNGSDVEYVSHTPVIIFGE